MLVSFLEPCGRKTQRLIPEHAIKYRKGKHAQDDKPMLNSDRSLFKPIAIVHRIHLVSLICCGRRPMHARYYFLHRDQGHLTSPQRHTRENQNRQASHQPSDRGSTQPRISGFETKIRMNWSVHYFLQNKSSELFGAVTTTM